MTDTPGPRRRSRRTVPLLAATGVLAVVALGILLTHHQDQPVPLEVASLPPASPGVVSAGYLDSHWRLTGVTDRRGTTSIPASIDAWLELAADGEILASDGVNTTDGHFTTTGVGFDVSDAATTLVGYGGNDPAQWAAMTGIAAMTSLPPAVSSAPSSSFEAPPVHVTVLSAKPGHLSIQAGGVRLTFVRSGPAYKVDKTPLPHISSAADR
ncbi:hypothetical protein [Actinoplanes sp. URMC 104]|uniref:hypothetical protein n=1 Tax=Actinoplanes sp. URMC 104 TaxID=3423409 RepID=UPI003F1BF8D6